MGIPARGQSVGSDDPAEGLDTITIAGSARMAEAAREALVGSTKRRGRPLLPFLLPTLIAAIATSRIVSLDRGGFRPLEAVIPALVGVIAASYLIGTLLDRPDWGAIGFHAVVPQFSGTESLPLAVGIPGAAVMPHVIYLHS